MKPSNSLSLCLFLSMLFCPLAFCKTSKENKLPPSTVEALSVGTVKWQPHISIIGTLQAQQGAILKNEAPGVVTKILFKPGQTVQKGDLLVQLNADILKAQVSLFKADLRLKEQIFKRNQSLSKKNTISQTEFDKALSEFEVAQAELEKAKAQLEQLSIRAPFSGRVGINLVDVGSYLPAGTPIVSLQDTQPMFVNFTVPETFFGRIKVGQTIQLSVEAYPNQAFSGVLTAFDASADPRTHMLKVQGALPNPDKKLLPGMFAEVALYLGEKKPVIMIPRIAVVSSEKGDFVFKIIGGKAKKTLVTLGKGNEKQVVIEKGLRVGDQIVTAGQLKLSDGSPVTIVKSKT